MERKPEIAKAKLKKARQQLNVQANPQQVQVGGGTPAATSAQAAAAPVGPPAVLHHRLMSHEKHKWEGQRGLLSHHQPQLQLQHQ